MFSLEDAIRIHVQNLIVNGTLAHRDDSIEYQLIRIEETTNILQRFNIGYNHDEILDTVSELQQINEAFILAVNQYSRFYSLSDLIENAIRCEVQDLFHNFPFLQYPVSLMRTFELGMG